VGAALGATAVAFLALVHVVTQSDDDLAQPLAVPSSAAAPALPPPVSQTPALERTTVPTTAATTTTTTTATATPPPPAATLTVDVALRRVRDAVEEGEESGDIRSDVALDFRNILGQLATQDNPDIRGQVDLLRRKVRQRLGEGAVTADRADVLQERLTDLGKAGA
jgi:serine/threonine-protein kinase